MRPLRFFVTGTDTGVGKTQVSCALLSLMADAGLQPAAFKPYESGIDDPSCPEDATALMNAARSGLSIDEVSVHRFREPLAPGVAAHREGRQPSIARTRAAFHRFDGRSLVVEGAGGLFVPLDRRRDVIDLVAEWRLPVILVARAGLGTLNHIGLSMEAMERRRIKVAAVVLNRTVPSPDLSEQDNPRLVEERHRVKVLGPVPFATEPKLRRAAFRKALRSLVPARQPR